MLLNCGAGEDSWESLRLQEVQPVNPKGNQPWIFIGRTDAEAEAPIIWPPTTKSWLIGKDPDAEKDWRQKEKGTTSMDKKWLQSITDSMDQNLSKLWKVVEDRGAWHAAVREVEESNRTLLLNKNTIFKRLRMQSRFKGEELQQHGKYHSKWWCLWSEKSCEQG